MDKPKLISHTTGSPRNSLPHRLELPYACRSLQNFMSFRNWSLQKLSDAIGDEPERLERVIQGTEPLGKTAQLALLANYYGLAPISRKG